MQFEQLVRSNVIAVGGRRVVVTGIGVVSSLGSTVEDFFTNLCDGRSGVGELTRFDTSRCPIKRAAELTDFDPAEHGISERDIRVTARFQWLAIAASQAAASDAGLDLPRNEVHSDTTRSPKKLDRFGVAIGVAYSNAEILQRQYKLLEQGGSRSISARLCNLTLPNSPTSAVSIRHGLTGPLVTVSGASASGAESLIAAYDKIKYGRAELMLTGGAESAVNEITIAAFAQNRTGSRIGVCRPFDDKRDGTILGEGAGVVVLEELEHARARGARIYGEVLGYGLRGDAYDMSDIRPDEAPGMRACLEEVLLDAGVSTAEVGYINVHGTGTKMNDPAEAFAIRKVFGSDPATSPMVSGTKGATGHMLGGTGGVEFITALLASNRDVVPPTYGLENPDPRCADLNHVIGKAIPASVPTAITTSVGMGGNNSAIMVRGWSGGEEPV
ncbi:beta-ketoacyl-ACP synthase II [Allokutzneria multivorans]|uniref:Beta-ketoacyl-ACP synthase II n=1 Tax=Allokutzneria multivorans TaxID=1142134 RepID=A0ABP7U4I6_9PSEU